MNETLAKILEISKEIYSLLKTELKRLYKLLKSKFDFTVNKQKTLKNMYSPMIQKREASLKKLNEELTLYKKETKSLSSNIDKNLALIEELDEEISILSK